MQKCGLACAHRSNESALHRSWCTFVAFAFRDYDARCPTTPCVAPRRRAAPVHSIRMRPLPVWTAALRDPRRRWRRRWWRRGLRYERCHSVFAIRLTVLKLSRIIKHRVIGARSHHHLRFRIVHHFRVGDGHQLLEEEARKDLMVRCGRGKSCTRRAQTEILAKRRSRKRHPLAIFMAAAPNKILPQPAAIFYWA